MCGWKDRAEVGKVKSKLDVESDLKLKLSDIKPNVVELIAVSYTHLDVYKRQHPNQITIYISQNLDSK